MIVVLATRSDPRATNVLPNGLCSPPAKSNPGPKSDLLRLTQAFREFVPSWPLIVGLVFFVRALAQPMALLNDPDTYLHIAAGRWMLAHAALPVHDPFSHTLAGATWVPHEWLAEIVLAAAYDLAGWSGLVLLTAAAFAASLALRDPLSVALGRAVLDLDRGGLGCGTGARSLAGAAPSARLAAPGGVVGGTLRRPRHRVRARPSGSSR